MNPTCQKSQRHLLLGCKASVTLKTLLTQNSAITATVTTKTHPLNAPAGGTPHLWGRNVTATMGSVCPAQTLSPGRAHPVLMSRAWPMLRPCGCPVTTTPWGQGPTQPVLAAQAPQKPSSQKMLHVPAGDLEACAPKNVWGELLTSPKPMCTHHYRRNGCSGTDRPPPQTLFS